MSRRPVSFLCLDKYRTATQSQTCRISGATGRERLHANPSRMEQELAIKLQDNGISYQTQVEIPVTTADFYFPIESRPLLVFVDGRVHLKTNQMMKDEETRT